MNSCHCLWRRTNLLCKYTSFSSLRSRLLAVTLLWLCLFALYSEWTIFVSDFITKIHIYNISCHTISSTKSQRTFKPTSKQWRNIIIIKLRIYITFAQWIFLPYYLLHTLRGMHITRHQLMQTHASHLVMNDGRCCCLVIASSRWLDAVCLVVCYSTAAVRRKMKHTFQRKRT